LNFPFNNWIKKIESSAL